MDKNSKNDKEMLYFPTTGKSRLLKHPKNLRAIIKLSEELLVSDQDDPDYEQRRLTRKVIEPFVL